MKLFGKVTLVMAWTIAWFTLAALGGLYLFCPETRQRTIESTGPAESKPTAAEARVTKENFDRILPGMTKEQVDGILGQAGEELYGHTVEADGTHRPLAPRYSYKGAGRSRIVVTFDGDPEERVIRKVFISPDGREEVVNPSGP